MDRNRDPAPDGLKFGAFRSAKPWMPAIPQRSVVKKQQSFLMDMEDDDAGHSATPLEPGWMKNTLTSTSDQPMLQKKGSIRRNPFMTSDKPKPSVLTGLRAALDEAEEPGGQWSALSFSLPKATYKPLRVGRSAQLPESKGPRGSLDALATRHRLLALEDDPEI
eukprot:EG_transcript_13651